jgi:hypothetical protein
VRFVVDAGGPARAGSDGNGSRAVQADAFVTLDADLARRVAGVVTTAPLDALR